MKKFRVWVDFGPASSPAPGTARHVTEQGKALKNLAAPFQWKPIVNAVQNPLYDVWKDHQPLVIPGNSVWKRATLGLAQPLQKTDVLFSTAYFVPWRGRCVANFFDNNIYEYFQTWVDSGRLLNALLIRTLCNFSVFRSAKLFVNSNYCADSLRKRFPRFAHKFVVTPPGINQPAPVSAGIRPKWAELCCKGFLLYVGTFSQNKNQPRLIEAYISLRKELPVVPPLVLVGPCPEDFLQTRIKPLLHGLPADWVLVAGRVPEEELIWAYHHATAYFQPSIAEGFGLPVIEAMSYGLPVACSNTTSLPETAGDAALFFNPLSIESIGSVMLRLIRDSNLRNNLRTRGDKRWREFTWEKNAQLIVKEITQMSGHKSGNVGCSESHGGKVRP